jgi:hypothetical protein
MNAQSRSSVAYIASRLATGKNASSVYDYDRGTYVSITGTVTDTSVNVYDFDRSCFITGHGNNGIYTLYDYGTSAHINLKIDQDGRFTGYDYGSSAFFNGTVQGRNVSLYDYGDGRYHNYTV